MVSQHYDLVVEWDATTGRELRRFEGTGMGGCLTLSPDGTTAAFGSSSDAALHLLDLATGEERPEGAHRAEVGQVAFAPDGKTLASAGRDRTVRLWEVATGTQRYLLQWPGQETRVIAFAPDGKVLAVGGPLYGEQLQATIRLCDVGSGEERLRIDAPGAWLGTVAFAPDGRTLAAFTHDRENRFRVSRWDAATGQEVGHAREIIFDGLDLPPPSPPSYRTPPVDDVAFSPDLALLAVASGGSVYLVDPTTGREVHRLKASATPLPTHLVFSPDGTSLVSGAWDKTVRLWDVATGEPRRNLDEQPSQLNAVAFAPDGRRFAGGMGWLQVGAIRVWDAGTGEVVREIKGHGCFTGCLAFSPDGRLLASGLRDTTVLIWDLTRRDAGR